MQKKAFEKNTSQYQQQQSEHGDLKSCAQTDLSNRPSSKKKCPTPGCSGQGSTNIYAKSHRAIRYCPNKGNSVASLLINQKKDEDFSEVEDDEISSDDAEP